MKIRIGYDLAFTSSMPTPAMLMLSVNPSRLDNLSEPQQLVLTPQFHRRPLRITLAISAREL